MRTFGTPIVRMGTVTSTMDVVRHLERQGAPEGIAVMAATQTAGRGRGGRTWDSPESSGLYCSLLLRPSLAVERFQPFSIAVGLAICDALDPGGSIGLQVKWPNDIIYDGRKLAGILVTTNLMGSDVGSAVLGFGLNLQPNAATPTHAVALAEIPGMEVDLVHDPFPQMAEQIGARYVALASANSDNVLDGWEQRLAFLGQMVTIQDGDEVVSGAIAGLANDGALLLDTGMEWKRISTGDLIRGPKLRVDGAAGADLRTQNSHSG